MTLEECLNDNRKITLIKTTMGENIVGVYLGREWNEELSRWEHKVEDPIYTMYTFDPQIDIAVMKYSRFTGDRVYLLNDKNVMSISAPNEHVEYLYKRSRFFLYETTEEHIKEYFKSYADSLVKFAEKFNKIDFKEQRIAKETAAATVNTSELSDEEQAALLEMANTSIKN